MESATARLDGETTTLLGVVPSATSCLSREIENCCSDWATARDKPLAGSGPSGSTWATSRVAGPIVAAARSVGFG